MEGWWTWLLYNAQQCFFINSVYPACGRVYPGKIPNRPKTAKCFAQVVAYMIVKVNGRSCPKRSQPFSTDNNSNKASETALFIILLLLLFKVL
jgi:hypothetical protein